MLQGRNQGQILHCLTPLKLGRATWNIRVNLTSSESNLLYAFGGASLG